MEVMNNSNQTILLRKDFALNGPAVYDKEGNAMSQRRALEVKTGEIEYYRIEPGQKVSVKAAPNYTIDKPGEYVLKFALHVSWWGFEETHNPGKMMPKDTGTTAISNEVKIFVHNP